MKISYNWLKQFIKTDLSVEKVGKALTSVGLEVEHIEVYEQIKGALKGVVIGEVITCEKHPDADKLSVTTVNIGSEIVPIVCGAPNVAKGQKVVVATVGTDIFNAKGENLKIKKAKIRGQESQGMICAEDEIGLGNSHDGIMILDTNLPNGTPASEYFKPESDFTIEIGLTPNHIDAASHYGVARDLKALWKTDLQKPDIQSFTVDNQNLNIEVIVENTEACPRYAGLTISGIKVQESPNWLKQRLLAIGLSPINNIVDATNYVLHDLGQPLHAFDADKITGKQVRVKTLEKNTLFKTLDKQDRKLSENDLMICDANSNPLCIAGVFGGLESGISEQTQNIFLESAYFSPNYVRKTSLFHGLKTDASFRFERGIDPNITVFALKRAALLIKELAGGQISSEIVDIYPKIIENFVFEVKYKNIDRLIGKVLDKTLIKQILSGLEIEISQENEEKFTVSVPPYRVDCQKEADIVEEILRIYGYDNIELSPYLNTAYLADFQKVDRLKTTYQIIQLLAANGFCEMFNNSLTKPAYADSLEQFANKNVVIINKLSADLEVMRQTLLFSGLEAVSYNINRKNKELKLFEVGKVYAKVDGKYEEKEKLSLFVTGNKTAENWQQKSQKSDFHTLVNTLQLLLDRLRIDNFEQQSSGNEIFQYGLSYMVKNHVFAQIGLLKKSVTSQNDIKQDVFYAELDWDWVIKNLKLGLSFKEMSKFPSVRRDLSLVIDQKVSFEEMKKIAFQTERNILEKINVFDVYEGENLGEGKKSYSMSFILQDSNKTLTDQMIEKAMQKLMNAFETQVGAVIRK